MLGRKSLRKPENWQDFETLCKKLWGEIWCCPEIKKNGRSGQAQHGVDVYGVPDWADGYYGIQCKGKDEYTSATLDAREIDAEIEKARHFNPPLKKLYFATTANKDAVVEAHVRSRSIENKAAGSFGIELYCWEDIVDLIDENKATHDWYVESRNFRSLHRAALTFENGETSMECSVPFRKKVKRYYVKTEEIRKMEEALALKMSIYKIAETRAAWFMHTRFNANPFRTDTNRSYCNFRLKLANLESAPIKQYKVFLSFEGAFEKVDVFKDIAQAITRGYDVSVDGAKRIGVLTPYRPMLVQDDVVVFDKISIRPPKEDSTVKIHWKLVSEDYKTEGTLTLDIRIDFKTETERIEVSDESEERVEETIEDYIVTDSDDEEE